MSGAIPGHIRPIAYGMSELFIDMVAFMRRAYGSDLDAALIMICVSEATMDKYMHGAKAGADVLRREYLEDSERGSISRRMIAEKTGLPRETVRRKVANLIAQGFLYTDADGAVRATPRLHDPEMRDAIMNAHQAIKRYVAAVKRFEVD